MKLIQYQTLFFSLGMVASLSLTRPLEARSIPKKISLEPITNQIETKKAGTIPLCIGHIEGERGSTRIELGLCEFYSHYNTGEMYVLENHRNPSIKDRLHIDRQFTIIWGDIVNLFGNIVNTINETLSLVIIWAIDIKLVNFLGAIFNLLISIAILIIDLFILVFQLCFFFIFIPIAIIW